MKYVKRRLVKYGNRLFPKCEEEHWEVKVDDKLSMGFSSWENALIFDKLMKLEHKLNLLIKDKE